MDGWMDRWMDGWMEGLPCVTLQLDEDWSHGVHVSGALSDYFAQLQAV